MAALPDAPVRLLDPQRFAAELGGRQVGLYTVRSDQLQASWCNQGARLLQLLVPDRQGRWRDVVLGHDSLDQLQTGMASMGAFIGRFANRIAHAQLTIDGQTYRLPANDGPHCVHGGPGGSRHQVFDLLSCSGDRLSLGWTFLSRDDGFPGDVDLRLDCQILGATLDLRYRASVRGAATALNFTCHPFFNLDGDASPNALDHLLQIEADHFVPVDAGRIPLGHLEPVAGTAFDFRQPRVIAQALAQGHPQLGVRPGFDHAYLTRDTAPGLRRQARLCSARSGIAMEVWSDAPGLQFFSAAAMDGIGPRHAGKHGRIHGPGAGVCLEPEHLPDAPNQPGFGSWLYRPGQCLSGQIQYRFSIDPAG